MSTDVKAALLSFNSQYYDGSEEQGQKVQDFLAKLTELYALAPGFCTWFMAAVPASLAAFACGGYWLAKEIHSGSEKIGKAQLEFLQAQLALAKHNANNATTAVVDAKKEAAHYVPLMADRGRDRLDERLSTALVEAKVVVIMLDSTGKLARSMATGEKIDPSKLDFQARVPRPPVELEEVEEITEKNPTSQKPPEPIAAERRYSIGKDPGHEAAEQDSHGERLRRMEEDLDRIAKRRRNSDKPAPDFRKPRPD